MARYESLDLELECDGGGVAQKAALFGGMFKRSSKAAAVEPSVQTQDSLFVSGEPSKSGDGPTDGGAKEKGGVFKGMFKKTTKPGVEDPLRVGNNRPQSGSSSKISMGVNEKDPDLSASNDSLADNKPSKDKAGVLSGILKRPAKPGHARRPSQDLLDIDVTAGDSSLSDNNKESGGMLGGIFKRSPKPLGARAQSQDDLSASNELSGSSDNLSANYGAKESGGMFSGMFRKSPKPFGARTKSQDNLSEPDQLSNSTDNLSANHNATQHPGGVFGGIFKKPPKRAQSQDDLSEPANRSGSAENVSESNTKEKGGLFSGVFKKPKTAKSQDDLTADSELSASSDSLAEKSSKGGAAARLPKNPFVSSAQDKEKAEHADANENTSTEKSKTKQNGFSAMMKSTFYGDKQERSDSEGEGRLDDEENQAGHKQSKLAGAMTKLNPFRSAHKYERPPSSDEEDPPANTEKQSGHKQNAMVGAMSKLNPFRSANKKDSKDTEAHKETEKKVEENPKSAKSNAIDRERKEKGETPPVPARPTEEEMKHSSANDKRNPEEPEDSRGNKDVSSRQRKEKPSGTPLPPPRAQKQLPQSRSNEETPPEDAGREGDELNPAESKTTKKKHKHHNPFMPRAAARTASDDEGLKEEDDDEAPPKEEEEKKEEEAKVQAEETKVKKPKRHNPFMPRVKAKVVQKKVQDGASGDAAENEGGSRSLFERLEDLRMGPSDPGDGQDVDLMDWWQNVESWEDTPQDEDMTEKEEAKAFAVTAEKVQKGIRVFNKLFSERAESLWQHVIDLNDIAEGLDKFNKNTKIAQITGGSTSAIGGVATIAGLALAPVTMGTSLIVTAVGLGVATAGGLTSAGAGISNQVNNSMDRKKVEKIVEDYQEKITDLNKCLKFIKQGIENLRKFDLIKMKNHAYNRDFPVLNSNFYEDGAMAGKAILINANEIMRVVQIANVAGSTAARAVQIASMATGVLTGLFVGMDIYFVAKDSKELKKGAKSEFAAKIREVATQLHEGLVELNTIREELQCTDETKTEGDAESSDQVKGKTEEDDGSEEDEIDQIKKAIKKDIENREYV